MSRIMKAKFFSEKGVTNMERRNESCGGVLELEVLM